MKAHKSEGEIIRIEIKSESDKESVPGYREQLLKTLRSVKQVSSYAYGGSLHEFCLPYLNVPGIGHLSLPLCEHQAKAIIAQCALAPFGRGEETIIDATVRNTRQISPAEFTIENKRQWEACVDKLAEQARLELGFTDAIIEKRLYKLLLYEQGGFFQPHRDSEKDKGMFASLIIILPSDYEGGQLVIRHNGHEKEFDFSGIVGGHTINYAAFYADCEHEVRTVTQGYRLCLVYNIINTGQDPVPVTPDDTALVEQTADTIRHWESDPNGPTKLVYLLEHKYTNVSLSFRNLKGHDRAVAQLMKQVQRYMGAMVGLANLKWETKFTEEWEEEKNPEYMLMTSIVIADDDDSFPDKALGVFTQDQVLNQKQFDSLRPQHERLTATGNEGTEVDRQYQVTSLVFCPKKNSSIMRWDLMGAKLSIAKLATITEAEGAREQAWALFKSMALKQTDNSNDPFKNAALLAKFLASLRQLHLVDEYLDVLGQNVERISPNLDLSSELAQGCSDLGWTELSSVIRQYMENRINHHSTEIIKGFHSLAFSPIPTDDQQRQSRSDLLDYTLKVIDGQIDHGRRHWFTRYDSWSNYCASWPSLIESLHHLGHHSMIAKLIEKLATSGIRGSDLVDFTLPIIKITNVCLSCDSFEASIQRYLVSLIEQTISAYHEQVSKRYPAANWERALQCKCEDCEKVKAFAHNSTSQTEQLTVDCNNWVKNIDTWAKVDDVLDKVKREGDPVAKKVKTTTKTVLLTKLLSSKLKARRWKQAVQTIDAEEWEQYLQTISYLQSLPYYHVTEAKE